MHRVAARHFSLRRRSRAGRPPRYRQMSGASPLLSLGLIADVQYADIPDGASFDKSEERFYRASLEHARSASAAWVAAGCELAVNLGDAVDGANAKRRQGRPALAQVLSALAPTPLFHVVGNHELYNFARGDLHSLLPLPSLARIGPAASAPDANRLYFHADVAPGWRLVVLDAYDIALETHHATTEDTEEDSGVAVTPPATPSVTHAAAIELLRARNPNPCAAGDGVGNFFAGLEDAGAAQRWVPFNGAVGPDQLAWLRSTLADAAARDLAVIVCCHVPLYDGALRNCPPTPGRELSVHKCLVWNYEEILATIHAEPRCTAAVFSGHLHDGAFGVDSAGIAHLTLESPLTHHEGGFAIARLFADRLELEGFGAVASRTLPRRPEAALAPR